MNISLKSLIRQELLQCRQEGRALGDIEERIDAALAADPDEVRLTALYEELVALDMDPAFAFVEPSTLPEIRAERPPGPRRLALGLDDDALLDRIHGGWLGRAAGCALGKPVEGWSKAKIDDYLDRAGALPLDDYVPYDDKFIAPRLRSSTRGNIELMDRDDDMDYPILGLLALEGAGAALSSRRMADTWLTRMPFNLLYTAENVAYRNFVNNIWPPESASHRNPFREWIGAQIRADVFGYAAPGWPEMAAELAFRDASISHTKNGIYGEMFAAAVVASAFACDDTGRLIEIGLSEIPRNCRLAEAIRSTAAWCAETDDWQAVWQKVNEHYGHYHAVHTINNAAVVVMSLCLGRRDYERSIVTSVRAGWDTDCNGATVGSVLGVRLGAAQLPDKWIGVLNDRLVSAVRGYSDNRISELAERTRAVARTLEESAQAGPTEAPPADIGVGGIWDLTCQWGDYTLHLDGDAKRIDAVDFETSYPLTRVALAGGELRFHFAVDKGGWLLETDFEGRLAGDRLAGEFYPGNIEVSGARRSD